MFQREALSARQNGAEVTIIGVADGHPAYPPDHGCRVVPLPKSSRLGKLLTLSRLFWLGRREHCDIYHCHDMVALTAGAILKVVTGRGLIYDAHENYPLTHAANITRIDLFRKSLRSIFSIYECLLLRFVDEVFTVDPLILRKFSAMGAIAQVLPNFPRRLPLSMPPVALPDWNGRRVFVHVGGLSSRVAVLEVLRAVDRVRSCHPDVLVAFVGSFANDLYRQSVQRYVCDHGLQDHVRFVAEIPFTAIPQLLSQCFAGLIIYSRRDTYGDRALYVVKMFEYMAAGLPIIASSFRGLSLMLLRRHCGLLVDPTSPDDIASAMSKLLGDRTLVGNLSTASIHAFESRYHWEAVEPKLLTAYRRVGTRA